MTEQQDGQPDGAEVHASEDRAALASDLANRFAFHPADTESRVEAHEQVRAEAYAFAASLADLVPPGRERSLAFTAIEEAMMWGNAGIARKYATGREPSAFDRYMADERPARRPLTSTEQNAVDNPGLLVGTDDMPAPAPTGDDVPEPDAAPARNVTEPAEAPDAPSVPPEYADEPIGGQPAVEHADPDAPSNP